MWKSYRFVPVLCPHQKYNWFLKSLSTIQINRWLYNQNAQKYVRSMDGWVHQSFWHITDITRKFVAKLSLPFSKFQQVQNWKHYLTCQLPWDGWIARKYQQKLWIRYLDTSSAVTTGTLSSASDVLLPFDAFPDGFVLSPFRGAFSASFNLCIRLLEKTSFKETPGYENKLILIDSRWLMKTNAANFIFIEK